MLANYLIGLRGAVKLDLGKFFTWTGGFLVLVAAGVLAYGIHDLQEGGVLPGVSSLAFDLSAQIAPSSWYATVLRGTINFTPATTWLQAIAWSLYLVPVLSLFINRVRTPTPAPAVATEPQLHGGS